MSGELGAAMGLIEEREQKNKKKMQPLEKSRRLLRVWLSREARAAQFSQSGHLPRIIQADQICAHISSHTFGFVTAVTGISCTFFIASGQIIDGQWKAW